MSTTPLSVSGFGFAFATLTFCLASLALMPSAQSQSKFFSTPSRGSDGAAKHGAQITTFQTELARMNACTHAGLIYAPTHPSANGEGCTSVGAQRLLADELSLSGLSPLVRLSAEGAPPNQRNYQIQNSGGSLYLAPADDGWNWQGGGGITLDRDLNLGVHNNLSVGGMLKLGNTATTCDSNTAGGLRYNPTTQAMEFCNGTSWGAFGGSGAADLPVGIVSTFNLATCPDGWNPLVMAEGRFIVGSGSLGSDTYSLGATGGSARHVLTVNEMPSHTHSVSLGGSGPQTTGYAKGGGVSGAVTSAATGGGQPHENRPPYLALLYCQKS